MLPNIVRKPSRRRRYVPAALLLLGLAFLLVGFARPQRVLASGRLGAPTIVLAFDVSGSMAARDVRPTRILAARELATEFLHELPTNYRVAVVTFAVTPRLVVAPTFDRSETIARLPTTVTSHGGTALGDGVGYSVAVAAAATKETEPGSVYRPGAVLLFSDGGQNAGGTTPQQAAVAALVEEIPVDAVVIGTPRGTVTQSFKVLGQLFPRQVPVPVDPATLREVSLQTGGTVFSAPSLAGTHGQFAKVYDGLRSYDVAGRRIQRLSAATAIVALLFVLGGLVLSGLWLGRLA